MTMPGAPCIYYGDEIGMIGEQDPGSRAAFPWADPEGWNHELLAFTRAAIALRRAHAALRDGAFRVVVAEGEAVAYLRSAGDDAFVVVVNAGTVDVCPELDLPELGGRVLVPVALPGWTGAKAGAIPITDGRARVEVAAREGVVLRAELP
jgi:glycosidase